MSYCPGQRSNSVKYFLGPILDRRKKRYPWRICCVFPHFKKVEISTFSFPDYAGRPCLWWSIITHSLSYLPPFHPRGKTTKQNAWVAKEEKNIKFQVGQKVRFFLKKILFSVWERRLRERRVWFLRSFLFLLPNFPFPPYYLGREGRIGKLGSPHPSLLSHIRANECRNFLHKKQEQALFKRSVAGFSRVLIIWQS